MKIPGLRGGQRRARRTISTLAAPKNVVDRLSDLPMAAGNPGNLRARFYLPPGLEPGAPLVVVLHGCTQDAAVYDHGSGWSRLADRHGFALLFPEQRRTNNFNLCFNWYQPEHAARGGGEPASIQAMVARMIELHQLDPARIYVTGLSAGGAMASVMLATYPEVFAGGAIIAGLPYGCADNLAEALSLMSTPGNVKAPVLGNAVRRASPHRGPWPKISVWHGSADRLVVPGNGEAIVRQWRDVHGLPAAPTRTEKVDGHPHRLWADATGELLVEDYVVTGMAHGTPLMPGQDEGQSGQAGAHMLDVGLSSTDRIAAFFGIAPEPVDQPEQRTAEPMAASPSYATPANDVQAVIENALRAAGLMR